METRTFALVSLLVSLLALAAVSADDRAVVELPDGTRVAGKLVPTPEGVALRTREGRIVPLD